MFTGDPYNMLVVSAGNKKFVTANPAADYGDAQALARSGGPGFEVGAVRLVNRSGVTATVGLGVRYRNAAWVAGQVTVAGAYTDATLAAQEAATGEFLLWQRGLATGNGFLVGATERFNTLSFFQTAAGDQTTPVLILDYWDGATWTGITTAILFQDVFLASGVGEKLLTWLTPSDWVRGGAGTDVPSTLYNVRVRHTVATGGTADPTASQLFVGQSQLVLTQVANNGEASFDYETGVRFPRAGVALAPIFSSPSLANQVECQYRLYV